MCIKRQRGFFLGGWGGGVDILGLVQKRNHSGVFRKEILVDGHGKYGKVGGAG